MLQMEHGSQFVHHGIAKMCTMICNDRLGYTKPSDDVIEQEKCCCLHVVRICWHRLRPFCEIDHGHYNVMMAINGWRVAHCKIYAALGEGANGDNRMVRSRVSTHLLRKDLTRIALFDSINTIFEDRWLEVPYAQNILNRI